MIRCAYCGTPMRPSGSRNNHKQVHPTSRTIDHVIPRAKFIAEDYDFPPALNTMEVCQFCNCAKGDMWPLDWLRVMPAYGLRGFQRRLLAMGCEASAVALAVSERKPMLAASAERPASGAA